jgi:hypothetical protein
MWLASKRRVRDRQFIPFDRETLFVRAFSVAAAHLESWDLFPPVGGYRPYSKSTPQTYLFSAQRQHADWSAAVLARDRRTCQECGATHNLEAHHIWPQSWYPSLRYVLKNGLTLCRACHERVSVVPEITPTQFRQLTLNEQLINANVQAPNFWAYFVGPLEKGRIRAYGLHKHGAEPSMDEQSWFDQWARLNNFEDRMREAASLSLAATGVPMEQMPLLYDG